MKELIFSNGDDIYTLRAGVDRVTDIEFDEVNKLAKVHYVDGKVVTIISSYISYGESKE